jgi:hypothetical protein
MAERIHRPPGARMNVQISVAVIRSAKLPSTEVPALFLGHVGH